MLLQLLAKLSTLDVGLEPDRVVNARLGVVRNIPGSCKLFLLVADLLAGARLEWGWGFHREAPKSGSGGRRSSRTVGRVGIGPEAIAGNIAG